MVCRFVFGVFVLALLLTEPAKASLAGGRCDGAPEALGNFDTESRGTTAPATGFLIEDSKEASLADYQGAGVVINFWATWCAPCVKEMPALDRLSVMADPETFRVLTLSTDRGGESVVREFYKRTEISSLPVALDDKSRVARAFGVLGLPTTILLDGEGVEVGRVTGIAEWDHPDTLAFLNRCLSGT